MSESIVVLSSLNARHTQANSDRLFDNWGDNNCGKSTVDKRRKNSHSENYEIKSCQCVE